MKVESNKVVLQNQKIAQVLRIGRKLLELNQVEFAKRLSISQSFVSKLEKGLMTPDAILWQNFCDIAGIPYSSMKFGYLDQIHSGATRFEQMSHFFSLDSRFHQDATLFVRNFRPLISFWTKQFGESHLRTFLKKRCRGLDLDFFGVFYFKANVLLFDTLFQGLKECIEEHNISWDEYIREFSLSENHGETFSQIIQSGQRPHELINNFFDSARYYDQSLTYQWLDKKDFTFQIDFKKAAVNNVIDKKKNPHLVKNVIDAKILQLQGMARIGEDKNICFQLLEQIESKQGTKCILQLKKA
jgi:transcriptional regulator with XRE-family HTH domain